MKSLLEAGVHFGHQTRRWNPKMRKYIFTERNGIHILDLQQTVHLLADARNFVRDLVADGGTLLFVGTKRQAQGAIETEARRCGMPFVVTRWLGGTLTNFHTIQNRIDHLVRMEDAKARGEFEYYPKKERLKLEEEIVRLNRYFGGIKEMTALPSAVFLIDTTKESIAVAEALRINLPIVSLVDTNCDPDVIDYPVPSNDDAIRAIKLITSLMADAVLEGLTAREFAEQASLEAEDVEVDAYKETGYVVSPDEQSPADIAAAEEAAAAEIAAAEAAKVAAAEAAKVAAAEAAEAEAATAETAATESDTPAAEADAPAAEEPTPEAAADAPAPEAATPAAEAEPPAAKPEATAATEPAAEAPA
ncbi:MAG: 30S ribosomal protein S2, partial [Chloroflexi bacterium]|nr:30S ribosomal protein S2 [Chloroflexota bacterium]